MATNVSETRDRVASMLTDLVGRVDLLPGGDLSFQYESARVFLGVVPNGDSTVVNIVAWTNVDLEPTPGLYQFVALHADDWVFGHLAMGESEGLAHIGFRHTLLGDFLDEQELRTAVVAVAHTANEIDNEIKEMFGGRLASAPE
jgi:Putative bacterial sensory transduction regulator